MVGERGSEGEERWGKDGVLEIATGEEVGDEAEEEEFSTCWPITLGEGKLMKNIIK